MSMNNIQTEPATWESAKAIYDDMIGSSRHAVMRACDLGDVLRALRLKSESYESFVSRVKQNFPGRNKVWASRMMTLSFRREAVQQALENGAADSPAAMYNSLVKVAPKGEAELEEKKRWLKLPRGPKKGKDKGGRPRKPPATVIEGEVTSAESVTPKQPAPQAEVTPENPKEQGLSELRDGIKAKVGARTLNRFEKMTIDQHLQDQLRNMQQQLKKESDRLGELMDKVRKERQFYQDLVNKRGGASNLVMDVKILRQAFHPDRTETSESLQAKAWEAVRHIAEFLDV